MRREWSTKRLRRASLEKGRCPLKMTRSEQERTAMMEEANLTRNGFAALHGVLLQKGASATPF